MNYSKWIGISLSGFVVVVGGCIFFVGIEARKSLKLLRRTPQIALSQLKAKVQAEQQIAPVAADKADSEPEIDGVYVQITGIVKSEQPFSCELSALKAVIRESSVHKVVEERDQYGEWKEKIESSESPANIECSEFYIVDESDPAAKGVRVYVDPDNCTDLHLHPTKKILRKRGRQDYDKREVGTLREENTLALNSLVMLQGEVVYAGSPPDLWMRAPRDESLPFIISCDTRAELREEYSLEAARDQTVGAILVGLGSVLLLTEAKGWTKMGFYLQELFKSF